MTVDPHSYTDLTQGKTRSLDLDLRADFEARTLSGRATLHLDSPCQGPLDLDTRDLHVQAVTTPQGDDIPFELGAPDPILGARLRLHLPPGTEAVRIDYATSPESSALQWLDPAQTAGGRHPYLFSQCQAIHARSVVPLQDTPGVRILYTARMEVPDPLRVVMSAAHDGREAGSEPSTSVWRFHMPQPIPPYLLAFAAGNLADRAVGPRSSIFCEPEMLDAAAWEFDGVEAMIAKAENLFGPYPWERFDLLCMPPSFPYGGMENPRLTFLTPTLLAGDCSLVNVVAHELAHSWTGNLVTNANMEHFWLNEGFTVYAERRILEALEGPEYMALHAAIGRAGLQKDLDSFGPGSPHTRLRTELEGVDPDQVYSLVPYEKGFLFVRLLHETVGQERFDAFLRRYIDAHAFGTLTTEQFTDFVETELPGVLATVNAHAWLYEPDIPENEPRFASDRKDAVDRMAAETASSAGALPAADAVAAWRTEEWLLYLEGLPETVDTDLCERLDAAFGLTAQKNAEILGAWLGLGIASRYGPAVDRALAFLGEAGRMKFLKPLYTALAKQPATRELAKARYAELKDTYHPIARMVVESVLKS